MFTKISLRKIITMLFAIILVANNSLYVFAQSLESGSDILTTGIINQSWEVLSWEILPTQTIETGNILPEQTQYQKNIFSNISKIKKEMEYVPWEVLVKFKPTKINLKTSGGKTSAQTFATVQNIKTIDAIASSNISVMKIIGSETVEQKITQIKSDPNVEYAEPNYIRHIQSFNDTYVGNLRWIAQMSWYQAFTIFSWNANPNITWTIVAVIDVWVAYDHPDLINQMWDGTNCKNESGSPLWWCIHGYDFVNEDNNPYPIDWDHGTHVAWTIAAQANNNKWILWTNFNARIMAIRAWDSNGLTTADIIQSIDFATQNGAKVINASFGGNGFAQSEYDAVSRFRSAWWLFVVAAGNDGKNNDIAGHSYPCDFDLDNIICVAATDSNDNLASFSNYWITSVDVWAPWVNIYSTLVNIVVTTGLFENFESISPWTLPVWWTQWWTLANWWVLNSWITWRSNVLYSDLVAPYVNNANSNTQKSVNTANASGVNIDFWTICDTQYSLSSRNDYMVLEASSDWTNFSEIYKRDESTLDYLNGNPSDPTWWAGYHFSFNLTGQYSSPNFKIRFRRVTDATDNNYNWCLVDDVTVKTYTANTTNEPYGYMDWTSMATPNVVWVVSLAWSMRPELPYQAIKSVIIGSGDSLPSLAGKTVSGKRVNAYKTLIALWGIDGPNWNTIYTSIWLSLSGQGIMNNFSSINSNNVSNFSGLYFAKMSGSNELGRITFATGLDLTDTGTQNFLSGGLPSAIGMQQGQIWFNPGTGFVGKNAILKMNISDSYSWVLWSMNANSFAVREWSGGSLTGNSVITSVYSGGACSVGNFGCSIYLAVGHFTQFDIKPTASIVYSPMTLTSGSVLVILTGYSEPLTGINTTWYTFTWNWSFTFTFSDLAGNTWSTTATVTWIDTTAPTATVIYSPSSLTNQNVVATLSWSETITWIITHTFTGNGVYIFNFTDLAGNPGVVTGTVTWIDKTAVTWTINYSPATLTNSNVVGSITFNKTWVTVTNNSNGTWYMFTWNGSFIFTFQDAYGNTGTTTATVDWIDKTAPTATVIYTNTWANVLATLSWSETITGTMSHLFTSNGTYIFTFSDLAGNTWSATATVIIQIASGTVSTWATNIGWATSTGIIFNSTGTLNIVFTGSSNNILTINVSGLVIQATWGTRDGILLPPTTLDLWSTGNANFGETWLPASSEWSTTRTILLTIQAGANNDSLTASGGYFNISFIVAWGTSGNIIKLYRSTNWSTRTANTPDTTCTLNSSLVCSFRTDHLSYFTTVKETTTSWGWNNGGWWGWTITPTCTLSNLICTGGKYVVKTWANCEWWSLWLACTLSWTTTTWADLSWLTAIWVLWSGEQWSIAGSKFSTELNTAYLYAYNIGITTIKNINQANMTGTLIRKHLAKMISNFAVTQLGQKPNTGMLCNFTDMADETIEMKFYSKLACQLGLMWLDAQGKATKTFSPNLEVNRAQFGTALSRTLRGNQYNNGEPYYSKHLSALQKEGIMKQIAMPRNYELRGYVMLMLMRSVQ